MEEQNEEQYCELVYKKAKFWTIVNIVSVILAFIVSVLSLTLNFIDEKLNFSGLLAYRIACIMLAVIGLFGLFFSWFKISRIKKIIINDERNRKDNNNKIEFDNFN